MKMETRQKASPGPADDEIERNESKMPSGPADDKTEKMNEKCRPAQLTTRTGIFLKSKS